MILAKILPAALANHLWQSTLFAAVAALLALALRKNRAQTRYTLWLIASLKFLVPFALLIAAGAHLRWPAAAPIATPTFSVAVQQIGQPFTAPEISTSVLMPAVSNAWNPVITILFSIWFVGFAAVLFSWWRRWMRIRTIVRAASPLPLETSVPVLSSPTLLEPGVFGIFRPVLLLPEGITGHLSTKQLESIFAHELCHVRRRDNLAAAIHMFIEALFWFHPLVWWIGARMMEERERACDEEVLRLGNQPQVYAESILKACQFYLESPLACVSGVTGSDLKKRIVRIMTQRMAVSLNLRKKLLLAAAATAALAMPLSIGLMNAAEGRAQSSPAPNTASFEVASIKPTKPGSPGMYIRIQPGGRFSANGITMKMLMQEAYGVKEAQIAQAPPWFDSEHFDIEAKPDESVGAEIDKLPPDQRKDKIMQMIQSLFVERLKLTLGHETRELPVYELVVAKNGPKFHESIYKPPEKLPDAPPSPPAKDGRAQRPGMMMAGPTKDGRPQGQGIMMTGRGNLTVAYCGLDMFSTVLSRIVGRIVLDKTGLAGKYDFKLQWTPDESQGPPIPGGPPNGLNGATPPPESTGPSLFTAIQEQLGLKLQSEKAPVDVLVIEHVEKPSEN
jgi:uncharacterized protein (TIGR03435 family)